VRPRIGAVRPWIGAVRFRFEREAAVGGGEGGRRRWGARWRSAAAPAVALLASCLAPAVALPVIGCVGGGGGAPGQVRVRVLGVAVAEPQVKLGLVFLG
jgi:hypothetical protein